jgi:hypothetical protein
MTARQIDRHFFDRFGRILFVRQNHDTRHDFAGFALMYTTVKRALISADAA